MTQHPNPDGGVGAVIGDRVLFTLICPDCGRQQCVERDETDPPTAVGARLQCDRCDDGDRHAPEYFDAAMKWVHPTEHLAPRDYDGSLGWTSV